MKNVKSTYINSAFAVCVFVTARSSLTISVKGYIVPQQIMEINCY